MCRCNCMRQGWSVPWAGECSETMSADCGSYRLVQTQSADLVDRDTAGERLSFPLGHDVRAHQSCSAGVPNTT